MNTTPSQTVGPFFGVPGGPVWADGPFVVADGTPGSIRLTGRVFDGAGQPVPEGLIEIWQADPDGRFAHPDDPRGSAGARAGFRGFGRCATAADGGYAFLTVKPGPVPARDGTLQAPHIDVSVFARGLLHRLVTRVYFPDEAEANAGDPVLAAVPDEARRTLVAVAADDGLRFDIHLQGPDETAFFAL